MTKKAVETGFISIETLAPQGVCCGDRVRYDGKIFKVISIDLYEHLIGIDECNDGENICWKRTESIEEYIPFHK